MKREELMNTLLGEWNEGQHLDLDGAWALVREHGATRGQVLDAIDRLTHDHVLKRSGDRYSWKRNTEFERRRLAADQEIRKLVVDCCPNVRYDDSGFMFSVYQLYELLSVPKEHLERFRRALADRHGA